MDLFISIILFIFCILVWVIASISLKIEERRIEKRQRARSRRMAELGLDPF